MLVMCQRQTLPALHAGSRPTQGMDTSNMAGGRRHMTADRSQAALPPPSVRGRPTGPAMAGPSQLAAERRQQGPQEVADGRGPRSGLAPTPTPTPSRASSAESSAVGSSSLAGDAKGGTPDIDPQELSHALEQATESGSSAAAAAGGRTGQLSQAAWPHA